MEPIATPRPAWSTLLVSLFAFVLIADALAAKPEATNAADPWFTDSVGIGGETITLEVGLPNAKSPNALYRAALKQLEATPESQLSKRIVILEQALSAHPDDPKGVAELLSALKGRKAEVLQAIQQAGERSRDTESALQLILPHGDFLSNDPSLLIAFLDSDFARQFERQIEKLGEAKDFDTLVEINNLIAQSGINSVLGARFNATIQEALASLVTDRWLGNEAHPLPGEAYLAGRLLKDPERKMTVRLEIPQSASDSFQRNLLRSFQRRWGQDFQFLPDGSFASADFALHVHTDGVTTEQAVAETTIESTVPGHVKEEPNPDFMALTEKYEKAAQNYELALKSYEAQYERYIENAEDREWNRAQQDLQRAASHADSVTPSGGPGGPGQEYEAAQANLQTAKAVAASTTSTTTPAPVKPRPVHLEVLDELYLVPSTLVTSEAPAAYEYTKRTLDFLLKANAMLELSGEALRISRPVQLQQERRWTQNEGVNPRDSSADAGDFSEQELKSALGLFTLSFGADCAKAFATMLEEARAAADPQQYGPEQLSKATLAMALRAQEMGADSLALSPKEVQQLAALAQDSDLSPLQFRAHCISLVTQKIASTPALSREQIESHLK